MTKKKIISGMIFIVFTILGLVAFYPDIVGRDLCTKYRVSEPWQNLTEPVYFNKSFSAIGKYYCAKEAEISKEECLFLKENVKGCKWCARLSGTGKSCYVIVDPPTYNLTVNFSCSIINFTYTSDFVYNNFWNETMTFVNGTGNATTCTTEFERVILTDVVVTNATGGELISSDNYSISNRNIISIDNTTYLYSLVNVSAKYRYISIVNNTQKRIQPRWQNSSCGIFNVTLETAGTTDNSTLYIKMNTSFGELVKIWISNNSNYSEAVRLTETYKEVYYNLTRGVSKMFWHFMDLNNTNASTIIFYEIDFNTTAI